MIITSRNDADRLAMYGFLRMNGLPIHASQDFQAVGRIGSDNRLMGVVAFNGFVGKMACIHSAGRGNWVSRDLIVQAFHYPFVQLGLRYLIATVAADNERALKFDRRMGFKDWERLPQGADDNTDLLILRMTREECPWIVPAVVSRLQRKAAA